MSLFLYFALYGLMMFVTARIIVWMSPEPFKDDGVNPTIPTLLFWPLILPCLLLMVPFYVFMRISTLFRAFFIREEK